MSNLAEALLAAIKNVREVQSQFKELRGLRNVIVEPQISMMEMQINEAVEALASGDVVRMLRAYEAIKDYKS